MKALSPSQIEKEAGNNIPDTVIEAVNNLLKKRCRKGRAMLYQEEIIAEIGRLNGDLTRDKIFANNWLDFEPVFERAGWTVKYDKPAYCEEPYPPTFEFTAKK